MISPQIDSLQLRPAVPEDAPSYRAHLLRIYAEPRIDTPYTAEEYPRTPEQDVAMIDLYTRLENSLFLVAVTPENTVVGSLRILGGTLKAVRHSADLALYIDAAYRGQGLGRRMMETGLAWAKAGGILKRIQLEVYARNTRAVRLYESLGFEIEGRRRCAMFQDGEFLDEYLMGLVWA
ncbi:MAG: GNAT family protein [bacterium]|nr:GNAT family protein [bacterium]